MRNDRVLMPVLHVTHKCSMFFAMYVLVFSSTTIRQLYFIAKMPTFGLYGYKVEGSGCVFNRKRGLAETDSYFFIKFDMF